MNDQAWALVFLIVGGLLSQGGAWLQSRRDRSWHEKDYARDRVREAKEKRLGEAEEYAKAMLADFGYMVDAGHVMVGATSDNQMRQVPDILQQRVDQNRKLDKRVFSGASALRSLDVQELNVTWEIMLDRYRKFDEHMQGLAMRLYKRQKPFEGKEAEKERNSFEEARAAYISSVDDFYRAVNYARSTF